MDELVREYIKQARQLSNNGCYSKAFDFYIMAFEKCPTLTTTHEPEFREVLTRLSEVLLAANKMEDIICNYSRALNSFPRNEHILNDTGKYLFKYGFYQEAWVHFQKALIRVPSFVNPEKNLNSLKNFLVDRWHFRMLNDKIRNEAYRTAIHQTLIPIEDSVLDIGTGTGLLSLYASECRPMVTTACDLSEPMIKIANAITQENDCDFMIIINQMSTAMNYRDIGGKRSLVLIEMFDSGLFGEHVLQTLSHAWEHLINPIKGRVIPNKAEFFIIGASCDFLNRRYQLCSSMKSLLKIPGLNVHVMIDDDTYDCEDLHLYGNGIQYLTEPKSLMKINFNHSQEIKDALERSEPFDVELKTVADGVLNTVVGYFDLYLTDKVTITTDPRSEKRSNAWQQAIFFDYIPRPVVHNEIVDMEFLLNGGKWTLLPEFESEITRISPETLRFLNDNVYMDMINGCIGMASVYLGQMSEMSQISIVDLCPFPMFGLQLLKRGAKSLICCAKTNFDKKFFKKVFKANDIPLHKITVLVGDDWSQDGFRDEKFHVVFCNVLELCGEVDVRMKEISQHLKQHHLIQGGIFMPSNVTIIGQLVSSSWLDLNNRLYDENVHGYQISKHLNMYQVTQNFCIDLNHLEYTPLTEPCVITTVESNWGTEVANAPIINEGQSTAILTWYTIELMQDLTEISTKRKESFIDGMLFLTNPKLHYNVGEIVSIMHNADPDGSFKLRVLEEVAP